MVRSAMASVQSRALLGRHSECEKLDRVVATARAGQSAEDQHMALASAYSRDESIQHVALAAPVEQPRRWHELG